MNKLLTYFWLAFYAFLSMGVQVNLHFCSDQLKTVGLWIDATCCHDEHHACDSHSGHQQSQCCDNPSEDCCSDETLDMGIEDEHMNQRSWNTDEDAFMAILPRATPYIFSVNQKLLFHEAPKTGPPLEVDDSNRYALFEQRTTYG